MIVLRLLGYLWSLPHSLLGLLLLWTWYRPTHWWPRIWWSHGAWHVVVRSPMIGRPAAQTHGVIIFYRDHVAADDKRLRRHELEHVYQGMRWGPLYVASYVGHFLWRWCFGLRMSWFDAYYGIYWERKAREAEDEAHGPF